MEDIEVTGNPNALALVDNDLAEITDNPLPGVTITEIKSGLWAMEI